MKKLFNKKAEQKKVKLKSLKGKQGDVFTTFIVAACVMIIGLGVLSRGPVKTANNAVKVNDVGIENTNIITNDIIDSAQDGSVVDISTLKKITN